MLLAVVEHGGIKLAARELDLSVHTIRTYLARLRDKSGHATLAQLLFRADGVTNIAREPRRLAAQAEDCLRLLGLTTDN